MNTPEARTPKISIGTGLVTNPEPAAMASNENEGSSVQVNGEERFVPDGAANVLVKHLFAQADSQIHGISYAVSYMMAEAHAGGDIIDVYHFDNDSVALSIADISGKGMQAAVHAALIKYGLRAYASHGLTPEKVLRALDRLYLENSAFEQVQSFATVFFGLVDPSRRLMSYGCAAHEPVIVVHPDGEVIHLPTTAPLIGVFDDQHNLFKERFVELREGTLFVAATDGVSEARDAQGELFGMDRMIAIVLKHRFASEQGIVDALVSDVEKFTAGRGRRDDIAVLAARFH